jgi:hypothetical protein
VTSVGITGHQNLPTVGLAYIRDGISSCLASAATPLVGVSSLAAGADQLFAELVLATGGELTAVIPCADYETTFSSPADLDRYRELLAAAATAQILDYPHACEDAYFAAGLAVVERADELIAVWDGQPARGHGGTADIVQHAREAGKPTTVIWPAGVRR